MGAFVVCKGFGAETSYWSGDDTWQADIMEAKAFKTMFGAWGWSLQNGLNGKVTIIDARPVLWAKDRRPLTDAELDELRK